jgi:rod shape-determining protein MreD
MNERYKDYLRLLGLGVLVFLLETAFLPLFPFAMGKPNLILLFIASVGLFVGFFPAAISAIILGILMDSLFSPALGLWTMIYLTVGWVFSVVKESDWEAEKIYLMLMMGLVTAVTYGMMGFFLFFFGYHYQWGIEILPYAGMEAIVNMVIWIGVMWFFPRLIREAGKDYKSTLL